MAAGHVSEITQLRITHNSKTPGCYQLHHPLLSVVSLNQIFCSLHSMKIVAIFSIQTITVRNR